MDAGHAKQALEEAMQQTSASGRTRSPLMSSKSSSQLSSPSVGHNNRKAFNTASETNELSSNRPDSSGSQRADGTTLPSISKPKAAKFRIKAKDEHDGDDNNKKRWKGSRGEIGKAPPDKKAEEAKLQAAAVAQIKKMQEDAGLVSIDEINNDVDREERESFLPPITSARGDTPKTGDRAQSAGSHRPPSAPSSAVQAVPKTEASTQDVATAAAETKEESQDGNPTPADPSDSPDKSPKKKKKKIVIKPLPVVECPKFRPYEAQMREAVVLVQAFASLLRVLNDNYGHREWAFKQHVVEEVAEIVLVSPSIPKVMDYFMDIIESMYAEGYRNVIDNVADQVSENCFGSE